ncbi:endoglucanase 4 [Aplysia californica]|uniref:Endoglucanase n=1 Tax=Aplysia californica TaxID=6500 RepID=A0ABM0K970_APLCA|nr:endoglucanase 4 [Aplysia californica]
MRCFVVLAVLALAATALANINVPIKNHWNGGFQGEACFIVNVTVHTWAIHLMFDREIQSLDAYVADVSRKLNGGKEYVLTSKSFNQDQHHGDRLCVQFTGHAHGDVVPKVTARMDKQPHGGSGSSVTASPTRAPATARPGHTLPPTAPASVSIPSGNGIRAQLHVTNSWDSRFQGEFDFKVTKDIIGWMVKINFNKEVDAIDTQYAEAYHHSADGKEWVLVNKKDRPIFKAGDTMKLSFYGNYKGGKPAPDGSALLINMGVDSWKFNTAPDHDNSKYNYNDVLYKSILFYETQRSGKLPASNRIPYRGDSAMHDQGENGEDLTGGWYDAGDHVKFNFPMSYSTTVLTWGYLLFPEAYKAAGQEDKFLDCIRWPLEYLLKCHTGPNELYVQVGDGNRDHNYWGPPEKMTMPRPSYKITASKPGSDVAMETAAAMSAGYLAFKNKDAHFANKLLASAKSLWTFAWNHQGKYSDSVPAAASFYSSFNLTDEMAWGSLWLHEATNDPMYLNKAKTLFDPDPAWGMSWDEKTIGNQLLLYKATGEAKYKQAIEGTYRSWFPGGDIKYTPKGLAFRLQWASLRYSSNMAMGALIAAKLGVNPGPYRHWAMCQIHYALGDTGFSYLIGFGNKGYPRSPHHRSSSCPNLPAPCGPFIQSSSEPNVHILYGALVGGPGDSDNYSDKRLNYVNNEVATDYNAGFTTAIAALKSLWIHKQHPEQTGHAQCPYSAGGPAVG